MVKYQTWQISEVCLRKLEDVWKRLVGKAECWTRHTVFWSERHLSNESWEIQTCVSSKTSAHRKPAEQHSSPALSGCGKQTHPQCSDRLWKAEPRSGCFLYAKSTLNCIEYKLDYINHYSIRGSDTTSSLIHSLPCSFRAFMSLLGTCRLLVWWDQVEPCQRWVHSSESCSVEH